MRPAAAWRRSGNWAGDTERAFRRLAQAPLFVAAVVATLTIGLGGFAVVYTAVDKILLEPMPYRDPRDLYFVWRDYRAHMDLGRGWLSGPDTAELQKAGGDIEAVAGMQQAGPTLSLTRDGEPQQVRLMLISPNLFDLIACRGLARGLLPGRQARDYNRTRAPAAGWWIKQKTGPSIIFPISRSLE